MSASPSPCLVVLAAGTGSRYGGPKQLDGVGPNGETLLEYAVREARHAGFGRTVLVVRDAHVPAFERDVVPRLADFTDVQLVVQEIAPHVPGVPPLPRERPWGTAHAVLVAREAIGDEPFTVVNADDHYGSHAYTAMARFLIDTVGPTHHAMVAFELAKTLSPNGPVSRGICRVGTDGSLREIVERTRVVSRGSEIVDLDDPGARDLLPATRVSMNFWGFHPAFLDTLALRFVEHLRAHATRPSTPRTGDELYLPGIVDEGLRANALRVTVIDSDDPWHGLTSAADREGLRRFLASPERSDDARDDVP